MSVGKLLTGVSMAVAGVAAAIALFGLLHEFTEPGGLHGLVHNLETWAVTVGYHTALIVLAAAGVLYLARK